jgi:PAS domain S-box-containing protein
MDETIISVLYVDDEPALLDVGKLFLERQGEISVDTADSASHALAILKEKKYDAIVSDYQMPGMDGIGFLKELRHRNDFTPFIIFTGRGREEVVIEALNCGADFYLQKGGEPDPQFTELAHKIVQAVKRRRAETGLKESEARMRSLFAAMSDVILVMNGEGRYIEIPPTNPELLGRPVDELIGKTLHEVLPKESADFFLENIRLVLSTRKNVKIGYSRMHGKNEVWFDAEISPLSLDTVMIVARDITRYHQTRNALEESETNYRELVELLPQPLFEVDEAMKITFVNEKAYTLFGYTREDIQKGLYVMEVVAPQDRERIAREIGEVAGGVKPKGSEFTGLKKDGTTIPMMVVPSTIIRKNRFVGMRGILIDLTDIKTSEKALQQVNEKLNLLTEVTRHDVLNDLLILRAYIALVRQSLPEGPSGEYLEKSERIAEKIRERIEFTRDYEEVGIHSPVWQDIGAVVLRVANDFRNTGITFVVRTGDFMIFADALFEKVILNLIDNAVKHGGTVSSLSFTARETGSSLVIVCEDDGEGIPAADKTRLFTKGFGKNTGLGLFLIKEILSITGITITENGEPGTGARFEITVPPGKYRHGPEHKNG